jgi:hypothetical protein
MSAIACPVTSIKLMKCSTAVLSVIVTKPCVFALPHIVNPCIIKRLCFCHHFVMLSFVVASSLLL